MISDNLEEFFHAVDRLNSDQLAQLRAYVDRRMAQPPITNESPQEKIAALHAAVEDFWDGVSPEEIDAIVEDMNSEYIKPSGSQYDWLDDEDKN